eukprot:363316-Chlamydomonas_euryale.AAC.1
MCNGVLLAAAKFTPRLALLRGSRVALASGHLVRWPEELVDAMRACSAAPSSVLRSGGVGGVGGVRCSDAADADADAEASRVLADLSHAVFVEAVGAVSGGRARRGPPPAAGAVGGSEVIRGSGGGQFSGTACGWAEWVIQDIGGRLLRIDMQFHASWPLSPWLTR